MSKAVPAQATGTFHERAAPPPLRENFACVWVHRMAEAGAPPVIVAPDGTIDLQWIDGAFRIAGPDRDPQTEVLPSGATVIGFRFRPAAAAAWLGVPAIDLVGQRVPLEELWGARALRLPAGIDDTAHLIEALERMLAQHPAARPADAAMRAAYHLIERGPPPGAPLVPWLMRALAMSERTLRRRFDESFGYGPKTLDRILRYQRFLRLWCRPGASTAVLASEAGYSDQAHLVRESRRLTGSTPAQLQGMAGRIGDAHRGGAAPSRRS